MVVFIFMEEFLHFCTILTKTEGSFQWKNFKITKNESILVCFGLDVTDVSSRTQVAATRMSPIQTTFSLKSVRAHVVALVKVVTI